MNLLEQDGESAVAVMRPPAGPSAARTHDDTICATSKGVRFPIDPVLGIVLRQGNGRTVGRLIHPAAFAYAGTAVAPSRRGQALGVVGGGLSTSVAFGAPLALLLC